MVKPNRLADRGQLVEQGVGVIGVERAAGWVGFDVGTFSLNVKCYTLHAALSARSKFPPRINSMLRSE